MMSRSKGPSRQQRQEQISRGELRSRLSQVGWVVHDLSPDMGEDFEVQIYRDELWTGVTFFVQLKSTRKLVAHSDNRASAAQKLQTAHLRKWEQSATPVVLIVWDTLKHRGCWTLIDDAVQKLNADKPEWRTQSTATVHVPLSDCLDDAGLQRLSRRLAWRSAPAIGRGKPLEGELRIHVPRSPEGDTRRAALAKAEATGDAFVLEGTDLGEVVFKDWAKPLFGEIKLENSRLEFGPHTSNVKRPFSFTAITDSGQSETVPFLELHLAKIGTQEATWTNETSGDPLSVRIVRNMATEATTYTLTLAGPGKDVTEAERVLRFLALLAHGGMLEVRRLDLDRAVKVPVRPGTFPPLPAGVAETVANLAAIQRRTGVILMIPRDWAMPADLGPKAEAVKTLLDKGQWASTLPRTDLLVERRALADALQHRAIGQPVEFAVRIAEMKTALLNAEVSLGPAIWLVHGEPVPLQVNAQSGTHLDSEHQVLVRFEPAQVEITLNSREVDAALQASQVQGGQIDASSSGS